MGYAGSPSYARAMLEVSAKDMLKDNVVVATQCLDDAGGYMKQVVKVEYEWKPPRCSACKVFGHSDASCPNKIPVVIPQQPKKDEEGFEEVKKRKGKGQNNVNRNKNGFPVGKTQQVVYRPVKTNTQNAFGSLEKEDKKGEEKEMENQPTSIKDSPTNNNDGNRVLNMNHQGDIPKMPMDDVSDVEEEENDTAKFMTDKQNVENTEGASAPGPDSLNV